MQKIHPRIRSIILALCEAADFISQAQIAQKIGVSAKTILREMAEVEQTLRTHGYTIERKTGLGVRLTATLEEKQALREKVGQQTAASVYTPEERLTAIAGQLLKDQEPVKLFEFAATLKVAESTVSNDLDKLESWFSGHGLKLVRKPGLGVHLEGAESDIRKAIVHYIYENSSEQILLGIFRDHFSNSIHHDRSLAIKSSKRLLNLMDQEIIDKLEQVLKQTEAAMHYKMTDNAYIGLIVHLALGLERLKKAEKIEISTDFLAELKTRHEFKIAAYISVRVAEVFEITMPEAETGYIAMHLAGSRSQYSERNKTKKVIDNFQLVRLTRQMLKIAEHETKIQLVHNEKLMIDLVHHLGPAISRLKMHMDIRNPLLEEMQREYPDLLKVSKRCAAPLEKALDMMLPEAEIAYIAMHIGAAVELSRNNDCKYTVAIACPTGMGTSKLLAANIQRQYPRLKIAATVSALDLSKDKLRNAGIDLLISTVTIHLDFPVVVVNSLLLAKDIQILDEALANLGKPYTANSFPEPLKRRPFAQRLHEMNLYGESVLQLYHHFFAYDDITVDSLHELIEATGQRLIEDPLKRAQVTAALKRRETYGSTLLTGQKMALLHCRDAAVDGLYFGILRLNPVIYGVNTNGEPEEIKTVVIMLAPKNCTPQAMETMGYLSGLLANAWDFAALLHEEEKELLHLQIMDRLQEFYKEKNTALMEG